MSDTQKSSQERAVKWIYSAQEAIDKCNKLERELAEARARIDHLERVVDEMQNEQALICAEGQSITELVAAKDKLIEQMRKALALFAEGAVHDFHYVCQHRDNCSCLACQKARVKAALWRQKGASDEH